MPTQVGIFLTVAVGISPRMALRREKIPAFAGMTVLDGQFRPKMKTDKR
jgi:hypothetical protein